jgi:type I restriction enzyme S subunit
MSEDLPEGWASTPLAAAVEPDAPIQYGILQPGPDVAGGVPYIRPTEIRNDEIDVGNLRRTTAEIANKYARASLKGGDVVLSIVGSIGKVAIVPSVLEGANITQSSARFRPRRDLVSSAYMGWFLRSPAAIAQYDTLTLGTGVPRLNIGDIRQMSIPVAPAVEQSRIVAQIEALMAEVSATRARLARVPLILKRFRRAVLDHAFSGGLTEDWRRAAPPPVTVQSLPALGEDDSDNRVALPDGWRWVPLHALATRVTDGTHQPPPLANEGIPFLLIGNIVKGRVDWTRISKWVSRETYDALTIRCRPELGDVLYTAVGATFGQAIEVDWSKRFIFQRHIAHIKPVPAVISARYLTQWLNSPASYARAVDVARGAAQPSVALGDLKNFPVPLCTLEEQAEIVRRVSALFALADTIERRVAVATARADKIPQAILTKAFRGELVPTEAELARAEGRTYEPASALLERIRGDRAKPPPSTTKAPKRKAPRA